MSKQKRHDSVDRLRGFIATPSGAKIPAIVELRKPDRMPQYSHVGEVAIPSPWVDEFEEQCRRFYFRAENGECFTQINILDAFDDPEHGERKAARLILLREREQLAAE